MVRLRLAALIALAAPLLSTCSALETLQAKSVVEYALPAAAETHEVLVVTDSLLVISQQTDGSLVKVSLDEHGQPTAARKWTVTSGWSGLHGLTLSSSASNSSTPYIWATQQFTNNLLQIDPNGNDVNGQPQVLTTIPIPAPASGPHGILEHDGNLWAACKDSSHVVRISISNPSDYQVWAVSGRPIFIAVHPTSGDVYSGLDLSSKIWRYQNDGGPGTEMDVPSDKGNTPVGTLAGPDGNVWVMLLGNSTTGTGTFGRINSNSSIDWFTLSSSVGATAGLIHVAFGTDPSQFWLLGSSTDWSSGINAVFTVTIDNSTATGISGPRIAIENSIVLPTQYSWTHRIVHHAGSLYVTELLTSTLAHVRGAAVHGLQISETWDQFADWGLGVKSEAITYNNTY